MCGGTLGAVWLRSRAGVCGDTLGAVGLRSRADAVEIHWGLWGCGAELTLLE
jgi:hypothetical protein